MAQYDALNMSELFEESERLDAQGSNDYLDNFVRMPEKSGYVVVRLLPPAKGKKFYCATRTHKLNKKNVHCPRELVNRNGAKRWEDTDSKQPCPICRYYSDLWRQSEEDNKTSDQVKELQAEARKIKPIERYYYNCIVRQQFNKNGEKEENVGPKILSVGKTLHQRIVRAIVGDEGAGEKPLGDITDMKNGRDFKIVKRLKEGKDAYPSYDDSKFLDPSVLGTKEQIELWLQNLHELSSLRLLKNMEEMKMELKKYLNLIPDEETGFDITEFQKPSLEAQIEDVIKPAYAEEIIEGKVDKTLSEDDFFEELRKVGN